MQFSFQMTITREMVYFVHLPEEADTAPSNESTPDVYFSAAETNTDKVEMANKSTEVNLENPGNISINPYTAEFIIHELKKMNNYGRHLDCFQEIIGVLRKYRDN